jgi:dienelactone hydrolase
MALCLALSVPAMGQQSDFDYRPVTSQDIEAVLAEWAARDLPPTNAEVIYEEDGEDYRFLIVKHEVQGKVHFGGMLLPDTNDLSGAPVELLADGLNQGSPSIDLNNMVISSNLKSPPHSSFIKIWPSFRGRSLSYEGAGYFFSEGDFCDAFDGATDDAIALLNVAEELFPEANFENILVNGGSRGGTVALLMGVRDPRVNTIIAADAPADFYDEFWNREERKNYQYQCQFLNRKTETEARLRMLASSPLHFAPQESVENVYIHHGEDDTIVPVSQAIEMAGHLESFGVHVETFIYPDTGHGEYHPEKRPNILSEVAEFSERLGGE